MAFGRTFERIAPILIADLVKELNLTPEQAAGFAGNFGRESGLVSGQQEGKPIGVTAPIRGLSGGIDWAQWTGQTKTGRRKLFGDFVESNNLPYPAYSTSLAFLLHELSTTHKKALDQVRKTTTVKTATETVGYHYEKFEGYENLNSSNYKERIRYAERALDLYLSFLPPPPPPIEEVTLKTLQRDLAALSKRVSDLSVQVAKFIEDQQ